MLPQSQIILYIPTCGGPMATIAKTSSRIAIEEPTRMAFRVNDQMIQYAPFTRSAN
jgi:hypothetical protein